LFLDLRQTIGFQHARNLKKIQPGAQPKVNIGCILTLFLKWRA